MHIGWYTLRGRTIEWYIWLVRYNRGSRKTYIGWVWSLDSWQFIGSLDMVGGAHIWQWPTWTHQSQHHRHTFPVGSQSLQQKYIHLTVGIWLCCVENFWFELIGIPHSQQNYFPPLLARLITQLVMAMPGSHDVEATRKPYNSSSTHHSSPQGLVYHRLTYTLDVTYLSISQTYGFCYRPVGYPK